MQLLKKIRIPCYEREREFPGGAFYCGSKHASTLQLGEEAFVDVYSPRGTRSRQGHDFCWFEFPALCFPQRSLMGGRQSKKERCISTKTWKIFATCPPHTPFCFLGMLTCPPEDGFGTLRTHPPYTRKPSITKKNAVTAMPMKIWDRGPRCRHRVRGMNIKFQKERSWGRPSGVQKNTPQAKVQEHRRRD